MNKNEQDEEKKKEIVFIIDNSPLTQKYFRLKKRFEELSKLKLHELVTEARIYTDVKAFQAFMSKYAQQVMTVQDVLDFLQITTQTLLNSDYSYDALDSTQKTGSISVTDISACPLYTLIKKWLIRTGQKKRLEHYQDRFVKGENLHQTLQNALRLAKTVNAKLKVDSEVWLALRLKSGIWLVGRADFVDFSNRLVVDVKTFTTQKLDKIDDDSIKMFNNVINQLILYMTILSLNTKVVWRGYVFYLISSFDSKSFRTDVRFVRFDLKRAKMILVIANLLTELFVEQKKELLENLYVLYHLLKKVWGEEEEDMWGSYCKFCPFNPLSRRYKLYKTENGDFKGLFTCPIPLLREGRLPLPNDKKGELALQEAVETLKELEIEIQVEGSGNDSQNLDS